MSQASHNDPERFYQESIHPIPGASAYFIEAIEYQAPADDEFFKTTALERMIERYSNRDLSEEAQAELDDILKESYKYKALCVRLQVLLDKSIKKYEELAKI